MPNIFLLADEAHGARLKSDLEYIGHTVQHLVQEDNPDYNLILPETCGFCHPAQVAEWNIGV